MPIVKNCKYNCHMYENELIHNFQKDCLLLFNMQSSTKNIMNKNQKYIHFYSDSAQTFILDDDFNLTQKETHIVPIYDNPMYHLESNWDKIILILNHKIPYYYLFVNNIDIFSIFISIVVNNKIENDLEILKKFFVIDKTTNHFIQFSYYFNIFNVFLFCDKFFDIVGLILDMVSTYDYNQDKIKIKIKLFLKNINIVNLYDLFRYIDGYVANPINHEIPSIKHRKDKKIKTRMLENRNYVHHKLEQDYFNNESDNQNLYKLYETIYLNLTNQTIFIVKILIQINSIYKIKDFDKLFLFSILSYRLTNKYIKGTWSFDSLNIIEYINEYKIIINSTTHSTTYLDIKNKYSKIEIKSCNSIIYNGIEFANCMENTILQFLKILFYDETIMTYNFLLIDQLIKKNYCIKIKEFFIKINNNKESSIQFCIEWLDFIYFIDEDISSRPEYKFKKTDKELLADLNNFFNFCIKIFCDNLDALEEIDYILKKINPDYNFKINYNEDKNYGVIIIKFKKIYNITIEEGHAYFDIEDIDDYYEYNLEYIHINQEFNINNSLSDCYNNYLLYFFIKNILNNESKKIIITLISTNIIKKFLFILKDYELNKILFFLFDYLVYLSDNEDLVNKYSSITSYVKKKLKKNLLSILSYFNHSPVFNSKDMLIFLFKNKYLFLMNLDYDVIYIILTTLDVMTFDDNFFELILKFDDSDFTYDNKDNDKKIKIIFDNIFIKYCTNLSLPLQKNKILILLKFFNNHNNISLIETLNQELNINFLDYLKAIKLSKNINLCDLYFSITNKNDLFINENDSEELKLFINDNSIINLFIWNKKNWELFIIYFKQDIWTDEIWQIFIKKSNIENIVNLTNNMNLFIERLIYKLWSTDTWISFIKKTKYTSWGKHYANNNIYIYLFSIWTNEIWFFYLQFILNVSNYIPVIFNKQLNDHQIIDKWDENTKEIFSKFTLI